MPQLLTKADLSWQSIRKTSADTQMKLRREFIKGGVSPASSPPPKHWQGLHITLVCLLHPQCHHPDNYAGVSGTASAILEIRDNSVCNCSGIGTVITNNPKDLEIRFLQTRLEWLGVAKCRCGECASGFTEQT